MKCDIFISYRRVDGRDVARTVQLALKAKGYENIFFDYDSLRDGLFNEQIIDAINMCKDFILILSPESMKRCCNEGDWVARELDTAIKAGCKFIPLNINGSFQEFPADFPRSLSVVKYIEQTKLMTDEYFDASIEMLVNRLDSKPVRTAVKSALCSIQLSIDETSMVYLNNEQLFKLKAGGQRLIENLETDKEYTLRVENLSRRGEEIVKTFIPGDQSILALSYAAEREERKRLAQEEKAREQAEREQRAREWSMRSLILDGFDWWYDGGEAGEVIVGKNCMLGYLAPGTLAQMIDCIYDRASAFVDGVACVKHGNHYNLIDMQGQVLLSDVSDSAVIPYGGYVITERGGMLGLIDLQGQLLLPNEYDELLSTETEHMYILKKEGRWAIYNAHERRLASAWYDDMQLRWSCVRQDHDMPRIGECYHYIEQKPIVVRRGQKYGLLDMMGHEVMACVWDEIQVFDYGDAAIVGLHGRYGLADRLTGQMITMMEYDSMIGLKVYNYDVKSFFVSQGGPIVANHMTAFAKDGAMAGVIDAQGQEIVPMMYDVVERTIIDKEQAKVTQYAGYSLQNQRWEAWNWQGQQEAASDALECYTVKQVERAYTSLQNYDQSNQRDFYPGRRKDRQPRPTGAALAELIAQTQSVLDKVTVNFMTQYDSVIITGCVKDFAGEVHIPDMLLSDSPCELCKVTRVSNYGFRKHQGLTAISLPGGVSELDAYTFYQCTSLQRVHLHQGLKVIGKQCFQDCTALTEVVLPEGLTEIADWAFCTCSSLKRIVIPEGVTSMGQQVFRECTALEEVVLPSTIEKMGDYIFHDCPNLKRICIPKGQKEKFRKLVGLNIFNTNKLVEY